MPNLSSDEATRGLMKLTARLAAVMAWLVVASVHLTLLLMLLVSAWLWRLTPAKVSDTARSLVPDWMEPSVTLKLVFIGIPLLVLAWLYVRAWRWWLRRLVLQYLLR